MTAIGDAIERLRAAAMHGLDVAPLPVETPATRAARANATKAQAVGSSLEHWLDRQHGYALNAGLARVRHVGPPVAHLARGRVEVIGLGPADYQGVLRGGRAVAVEAKSRHARLSRAEIPAHQQDDLAAVEAMGGLALLVVELRDARLIAAVPWGSVPWCTKERTRAGKVERTQTVGAEELAPWRAEGPIYLRRWA